MSEQQAARDKMKARLGEYLDLQREARQIEKEIKRLESLTVSLSPPRADGMPHGSGVSDPVGREVERKIDKLIELREQYSAQLERLAAAQLAIERLIDTLNPVARKLLRHRYIEGLKWERVCVAMNYSWRQTHTIHNRALDKLIEREGWPCLT